MSAPGSLAAVAEQISAVFGKYIYMPSPKSTAKNSSDTNVVFMTCAINLGASVGEFDSGGVSREALQRQAPGQ